jgi:hypothetical protein
MFNIHVIQNTEMLSSERVERVPHIIINLEFFKFYYIIIHLEEHFSFIILYFYLAANHITTGKPVSNDLLRGDRQILEKPIPEIIKNAEVHVIVEKNKKSANLQNL